MQNSSTDFYPDWFPRAQNTTEYVINLGVRKVPNNSKTIWESHDSRQARAGEMAQRSRALTACSSRGREFNSQNPHGAHNMYNWIQCPLLVCQKQRAHYTKINKSWRRRKKKKNEMWMLWANHQTELRDPDGRTVGAEGHCNPIGKTTLAGQTTQCSQRLGHQPRSV